MVRDAGPARSASRLPRGSRLREGQNRSGPGSAVARESLASPAGYALAMVNGEAMDLESAAMTAETDQIGPARVPLPGVSAYLSSVYELGRRSLRPALPALAFLFLYRLGVGAYGALTNYSFAMGKGALGLKAVVNATPILFLAFIYIPFLPLQDSLLRGHPIDFVGAIRCVLRVW